MRIGKGSQLLAKGPLRLAITGGRISCRGIEFSQQSDPLIIKGWESFDIAALEDSEVQTTGNGKLKRTGKSYPSEWGSFINSVSHYNVEKIMIAGKPDTGKSTLCTLIINRFISSGGDPYIVDSDIGQSDIGPPTTVGLGHPRFPLIRLAETELVDAYFAGDTSPAFCLEEVIHGTKEMMSKANALTDKVLLDTCGLVTGVMGEYLSTGIIEAVQPDMLVALERDDELGYLEKTGRELIHLPALPASKKNAQARRAFRLSQFLSSLTRSKVVRYDLSSTTVEGYLARRSRDHGNHGPLSIMASNRLTLKHLVGMQNTIVALHKGDNYAGIGVLDSVECDQNTIGILTRCDIGIDRIIVGNLRIEGVGETRLFQPG